MRLKVIRLIFFALLALIVVRLGYWQILKSDELTARAENQRVLTKRVVGQRGSILFKDGSVLVSNQPSFLMFLQPQLIKREEGSDLDKLQKYKLDISSKLAQVFYQQDLKLNSSSQSAEINDEQSFSYKKGKIKGLEKDILDKIDQDLLWVSLGRKVDIETKRELEKNSLTGLGFEPTSIRFYPEGSSSAHFLGFVGSDVYGSDTGYFGLEGYYDGDLKGKKGFYTSEKDALGLPILIGKFFSKEPKDGKMLVLNIDRTIQHIVENHLQKGIEKYGAKGGLVVVMEPDTGNILAMASYPNYDPQNSTSYPEEYYKNPVTADGYEPGSTFKVIVMSAAINEKVVKEDTICESCSGPINIGGFTIRTWNNKYQDSLTMTDTIIHSDNTGMVFAAKKLGFEKLYDYIIKFGFGQQTGIDLQDERTPSLRAKKEWKEIDLATASFGQGISVNAIQLVRAVSAIANGGKLMEPHIVSQIKDESSTFNINPKIQERPISEETARIITKMMVKAVDEGEAKFYKPKGYQVAGKTGTAQIPVAGHYDPNKTIASFVGFAPADNPKFVMLVRYDQPSASIYGSETAAPTFFEIAKELFNYFRISPSE